MKAFLILLLTISCTKIKTEEIKGSPKKNPQVSALRQDLSNYSPYVDIMVAFLWPEKFETQEQKTALKNVIRISRDLRTQKESFLDKRYELRQAYASNDCKCLLEGLCDGTETQTDDLKCYEIEDAMYENDRILPAIYQLVDEIKLNVLGTGGEWIETHQDFTEIPSPHFDFNKMVLSLPAFGATPDGPIPYEISNPKIYQENGYQRIIFTAKRKKSPDNWKFEVTPTVNRASLLFQGDLTLAYGSEERKGIIYWEHERSP